MAVTAPASGTQTAVIGTEHQLADTAGPGTFQFVVDSNAMASGDTLELRVYAMVLTAGTARPVYKGTFAGAQDVDDKIKVSIPMSTELSDSTALRFSLKQTAGTGRSYPWKVLKFS